MTAQRKVGACKTLSRAGGGLWGDAEGGLCDARGGLGPEEFEVAMRRQLRLFAQRQLSDAMAVGHAGTKAELIQMGTLKDLLREQARLMGNRY